MLDYETEAIEKAALKYYMNEWPEENEMDAATGIHTSYPGIDLTYTTIWDPDGKEHEMQVSVDREPLELVFSLDNEIIAREPREALELADEIAESDFCWWIEKMLEHLPAGWEG